MLDETIAVVPQVGLYNAFHRRPINRRIHGICVPIIMASGAMLAAAVPLPFSDARHGLLAFNAALVIVALNCAVYFSLEIVAALAYTALAVPTLILVNFAAQHVSIPTNLAINAAVQAVAWYVTVRIGHERHEHDIVVREGSALREASSNIYFDRGYFLLRNVGRRASFVESFQQFAIGPFAMTLDLLFALGYAPDLQRRIASFTDSVLQRLEHGEPVLASLEPEAERAARVGVDGGSTFDAG
jgi:uncharacterized membrane protein YGL010W